MPTIGYDGVVVARGTFLYDGTAPMDVQIVGHDFDYHYATAQEDELEPGQEPTPLGEDGLLYQVRPGGSPLFQTVQAAKAWADEQPWGPVKWHSER